MFINAILTEYCADRGIEFTRSRAYRKNDQAWVEQENGAVIRRFLGHERYSGQAAGQTIAHRHGVMRRYVNYFQPSPKLLEETRNGSATTKRYSPPASPRDRVIRQGRSVPRRKSDTRQTPSRILLKLFRGPSGVAARDQGSAVGPGGDCVP